MASKKRLNWRDVKSILVGRENPELLKLIADLYSLSAENKSFINSRYPTGERTLEPYRSIIANALYPDVFKNKDVSLSAGKKAISDYFKATKDKEGQLELMVHYLESGNQFTVDLGDIDEQFYSSLESMFERIVAVLRTQSTDVQERYYPRLENVVHSARNIGWGYYDYISDLLAEYDIGDT